MKGFNELTGGSLTFAVVTLASLALASGCCTKRSSSTAYYSEPPRGYASTTTETQYSTAQTTSMEDKNNMVVPLYKESLAVGKREVDAGSVRVRKVVKTETVNQPVELKHEEIIIERQPASGGAPSEQAFTGQETVINLTREEAVVEKRTEPSGQIVVQRRSSSDQTNIQAQVRSEDVDIVKSGNTENVTISGNVQSSMGGAESAGGQASGSYGTITDPAMLSGDASSLAGRSVQFSGLKVRNHVGDRLVVLSAPSGQTIYAVSSGPASCKPGDTVSLSGTIKAGGSSSLSGEAAQTLSSQPMYIDAQKIEAQ
jgi:uncharacterized protein (TIGR02271 family)